MDSIDNVKHEFDECFGSLQKLVDESFSLIEQDPEKSQELSVLWKNYVSGFKHHTVRMSDSHKNKEIYKAISKALMFG